MQYRGISSTVKLLFFRNTFIYIFNHWLKKKVRVSEPFFISFPAWHANCFLKKQPISSTAHEYSNYNRRCRKCMHGCVTISPARKNYTRKKESDISYWMLAILITGLALWVWYGFMEEDYIIIVSNSVSLLINISVLVLNIYYGRKHSS